LWHFLTRNFESTKDWAEKPFFGFRHFVLSTFRGSFTIIIAYWFIMAKASIIIGSVSITTFMICMAIFQFFIHGEQDWNLGIATAVCFMASISLGIVGLVISIIALRLRAQPQWMARIGLVINSIPGLWLVLGKILK